MSKKDYVAIGKALRTVLVRYNSGFSNPHDYTVAHIIHHAALEIAAVFAADNPNFDRQRFLWFVETGEDTRTYRRDVDAVLDGTVC